MAVAWHCCPLVVVCVLALHVLTCLANYEHTCTLSTRSRGVHPQGICGRNIPLILSDLCGPRGYMGRWLKKREAPAHENLELEEEADSTNSRLKGILLGKKEALSYLHKRQAGYGSQGITCECCYNSCTYFELLQYCQRNK